MRWGDNTNGLQLSRRHGSRMRASHVAISADPRITVPARSLFKDSFIALSPPPRADCGSRAEQPQHSGRERKHLLRVYLLGLTIGRGGTNFRYPGQNFGDQTMNTIQKRFIAFVCYAALMGSATATTVMAATPPPPNLYGTYTVTGTVFCQPGVAAGSGGAYDVNVGTIQFNSGAGVIAMQQTQVLGSIKTAALPFSVINKSYDYTFSNTATTITLNNTIYNVVYSNIQNGIPGTMLGVGVDANGCARSFTMQIVPPPAT
jgi:hypothetical protein